MMIENVGGSEKNNLRGTLVYLGSTWHESDSSSNRGVGEVTPNISVRVPFFEETFFFRRKAAICGSFFWLWLFTWKRTRAK